ncbi:HAD hydrolase-like protein [Candidatus Berkelbacteria bacterium]|nr:HAD hydrolase-like protein [Candidatus Berkelbacteria bacterium]
MKRPEWPDDHVLSVLDINFELLKETRGIRFWIVDLDQTLLRRVKGGVEFDMVAINHLKELRVRGVICAIAICSNVIIPSGKKVGRVIRAAELLGTPHAVCCNIWNQKPDPWGPRRAMAMMGARPEETGMVGDQILTDIRGAKRAGLYAVLVRPIGSDPLHIAIKRPRERWLLNHEWPANPAYSLLTETELRLVKAARSLRAKRWEEFHGFQVAKETDPDSSRLCPIPFGALYRALERLERLSYLTSRMETEEERASSDRPLRRYYRLTDQGLALQST